MTWGLKLSERRKNRRKLLKADFLYISLFVYKAIRSSNRSSKKCLLQVQLHCLSKASQVLCKSLKSQFKDSLIRANSKNSMDGASQMISIKPSTSSVEMKINFRALTTKISKRESKSKQLSKPWSQSLQNQSLQFVSRMSQAQTNVLM